MQMTPNKLATPFTDQRIGRDTDPENQSNFNSGPCHPHAQAPLYLEPIFEQIPERLKALNRWIVWRGSKKPWDAKFPNSMASSIDPKTWASYEQAYIAYEEGGFEGVAFVLAGDGIVGIDLDDCVIDGKPSDESMALMQTIGCQYIELSPSRNGLRGFGYVQDPPRRGINRTLNGLGVELYSTARYLTVTGHALRAGPLALLHGYRELHQRLGGTEFTEETEVTEAKEDIDFYSSVGHAEFASDQTFPSESVPTGFGQRNKCLFFLARHLKSSHPGAEVEAMKGTVTEWHRQVLPNIRTKEFLETWLDFKSAWRNIKYPTGIMDKIVAGLEADQQPIPVTELGSTAEKLYNLCSKLQAQQGSEPFFLDCHTAGKAIGISHTFANNLLKEFCERGLLAQTFKGVRGRASRYLLKKFPSL